MSSKGAVETEHIPGATLRSTQIPIICPFTEGEISQAWEKCSHTVQQHCDQMVARWKEEIDMFLVFAGLFSAVLTAFNVQSYALLQQDNSDLTAQALATISAHLGSFSMTGTSSSTTVNSTAQPFVRPPYSVPVYAIWMNTLWFSSLICTLSASSVAILVKQWLQQ